MQYVVCASCLYKMASSDHMRSINCDGNESLEVDMVNTCDGRFRVGRLTTENCSYWQLRHVRNAGHSRSVPTSAASPDNFTGDSDVAVSISCFYLHVRERLSGNYQCYY